MGWILRIRIGKQMEGSLGIPNFFIYKQLCLESLSRKPFVDPRLTKN